ncbi:MAG: septum site-determining protein MinC [bacterium]
MDITTIVSGGIYELSAVNIKGTRNGLIIRIESKYNFEEIKQELISKLDSAKDFFTGAKYNIDDGKKLDTIQRETLENICSNQGLLLDENIELPRVARSKNKETKNENYTDKNLVLRQNIRSGQKIISEGDLVIIGNVNPGAELIAKGNIAVMGKLKGMVHAGVHGNTSATITAQEMQPMQIRIAHIVGHRPDNDNFKPEYPEVAYLFNNRIVIDKYQNHDLNSKNMFTA